MLNFHKYHGTGNDFIMINNLDGLSPIPGIGEIKGLCDRHKGIGADGLIILESSDKTDCFMNYYNSDGTIAEMCGNGVRCTAKFFLECVRQDLTQDMCEALPRTINIDTRAGIKNIKINDDDTYSVDMGAPVFIHPDFPSEPTMIENFLFNFVSMGNPHAVTIVDDLNKIDLKTIGPKIENNSHFLNKINVEFVEKINDDYYKVLVWERGCGATLACGTGACAVFAVLKKSPIPGIGGKEITLEFPGGKLFLSKNEQGHIILRGPAVFVFKGEITL